MTIIMSKDGGTIVAFENTVAVYVGDNMGIKLITTNDKMYKMGSYSTLQDAYAALDCLFNDIQNNHHTIRMPSDEDVKAAVIRRNTQIKERYHGKKVKDYGGS